MTTDRETSLHRKCVQLSAENAHLKVLIAKQDEESIKQVNAFKKNIESIINGAKNVMTNEAAKCRDCDLKKLHQQIEALRPLKISVASKKR